MAGGPFGAMLQYVRDLAGSRGPGSPTEGQLLERFVRQRDEAAFAELVQRYGPLVLGLCRRVLRHEHDAEDVFQAAFLLLVRKAGSIAKRESVGSWLYGVAYRLARQLKATAARRQTRPVGIADMAAADAPPELVWRDLRPVLDEEVNRLPEKYRAPFVLCYLEGKTNEEAARQLRCPTGTVLSRLSRARERLRTRLARRGLALSVGALAAALSHNVLTAAVPPPLLHSTVKAATLSAAGPAALAGAVSARVAALTEGMVRAMFWARVRTAMLVGLVLAGLGLGGALAARRVLAEKPAGDKPPAGRDQPKEKGKPEGKAEPAAKGKTDPPGVPLEARLIAKKDTYLLDLDDRTVDDYRNEARKVVGGNLVMSPEVDLALEFRNTGSQALVFLVGGDEGVPGLELKGPGVISVSGPTGIQAQFLKGTRVTLAPGKTHTVPIKRLSFDSRIRSQFHRFYWAEAGVYTLTASYLTAVSPVPKGSKNRGDGFGAVTVTSAPARLTVVEPTESQKVQAKTDSPEVPLEARLVARKDTYALDLGGKTPEEIRTEIKQAYKTRKYPPVPAVDLVLEVTNTGKEGMRVSFEEGNQTVLTLDLRGRGAAAVGNLKSPDTKPVKFVELGPGKSRSIPITSLLHSYGTRQTYWTEPGEYTLRARLRTVALTNRNAPKEGGPAPGRRFVTLTSNLIKLKVVEGEKGKE